MNVNLGETFDQFIADLIKSGLYQSQSEVVREGLRLLKEREDLRKIHLAQLRSEVVKGIEELDSGNFKTYDEKSLKKLFQDIKTRGRKKLDRVEAAAGIRRGIDEVQQGKTKSASQVLKSMRKKHKIPARS